MTIRLSLLPSPRRTLPALAVAVALAFGVASAAFPAHGSAQDPGVFTGRYEEGVPVYRLAPIAVTAVRNADTLAMAAGSNARQTPHVDAATECATPST